MLVKLTFPKTLKSKILIDLEEQKKKALDFNNKMSTGTLGKLVGKLGKASPVIQGGFYLNYEWSDVTDRSLKLEIIMPSEAFMKESILLNKVKDEYRKAYGGRVKVNLCQTTKKD